MDKHTCYEQAYKNGYEKGYADAIAFAKNELKPIKESVKECLQKAREAATFATDRIVGDKWIPVTERLPESFKTVLCWYEYFRFGNYQTLFQTYGIGYYFRDGYWGGEVSNGHNTRVLAWMPLPEPPEGE